MQMHDFDPAQIIAEVEGEEQVRRDADFAANAELNSKMDLVFKKLDTPLVRSKFDRAHVEPIIRVRVCDIVVQAHGSGFEVRRDEGRAVCQLAKRDGKMELEVFTSSDLNGTFDDPEIAFRRIILALIRDKRETPSE